MSAIDVLNKQRVFDDICYIQDCRAAAAAESFTCTLCGYTGAPLPLACACDGMYCPCHPGRTCPVCDNGDGNVDPWQIIREVRAALLQDECNSPVSSISEELTRFFKHNSQVNNISDDDPLMTGIRAAHSCLDGFLDGPRGLGSVRMALNILATYLPQENSNERDA